MKNGRAEIYPVDGGFRWLVIDENGHIAATSPPGHTWSDLDDCHAALKRAAELMHDNLIRPVIANVEVRR